MSFMSLYNANIQNIIIKHPTIGLINYLLIEIYSFIKLNYLNVFEIIKQW